MPAKRKTRSIGLARALSKLGYCSRSQAEKFIREGRVQLNGRVRHDPETPVCLQHDRVAVDGRALEPPRKIYLMMNKPRGVVTTAADEEGRETVYDILKKSGQSLPWVAPVGRLDKASEGLLLLTNDSEWGARITAPESHVEKTYHVQIAALADEKLLQAIVRGVRDDQVAANPHAALRARQARLLRAGEKNCWLEIVLDEGKNRQIRRILAAFEIEVLRLVRVAVGPLQLGELAKGAFRQLTNEEKKLLDRATTNRRPPNLRPRASDPGPQASAAEDSS